MKLLLLDIVHWEPQEMKHGKPELPSLGNTSVACSSVHPIRRLQISTQIQQRVMWLNDYSGDSQLSTPLGVFGAGLLSW